MPASIQIYLSFLRGLSLWIGKAGFIKKPAFYGLTREEYERHEASEEDKSWSAHGIDIDALIADICRYDPYVVASIRLIRAPGLRRKEALMFRPHSCVVPFEATGLSLNKRKADRYAAILAGSKGGRPRYIPLDTPERIEAVWHAQSLAADRNAHMGRPGDSLKQSMTHFMYVMWKFGITKSALGVAAHGLWHEALIERLEEITGQSPPVREGGKLPNNIDKLARSEVAETAGHVRGGIECLSGNNIAEEAGDDGKKLGRVSGSGAGDYAGEFFLPASLHWQGLSGNEWSVLGWHFVVG